MALLDKKTIEKTSSNYIKNDKKIEEWDVLWVDVTDDCLSAEVEMTNYCRSAADNDEFHLSYFTGLEIVSQLQIIFMHVWAGMQEKTKEVWMIECNMKSHRPIKDPASIKFEMKAIKIRKRGDVYYCTAEHKVTDSTGGLFEVWIKALMS